MIIDDKNTKTRLWVPKNLSSTGAGCFTIQNMINDDYIEIWLEKETIQDMINHLTEVLNNDIPG